MALALGVLSLILHQTLVPGILHDDGVYLMLARGLAEGHGYVYEGVPGSPPGAKFPPLYPALLALYWTLTGGDVDAVARLAVATNLLSLVGLGVALERFARLHLALPLAWSMASGLLVGPLAAPWRYALVPLSDAPGLLLAVLLVGAATRMERAPPEAATRATLRFLLLFVVAFHLRTALLAVGVAGGLGVIAPTTKGRGGWGRWRRGAVPMAGVLGLALPWLILSRVWTGRIPTEFRDLLGGYGDWLGSMAAVGRGPLDGVGFRSVQVLETVGRALVPGVPDPARWVPFVLLVPFMAVGVWRIWSRSRSGVFALVLLTAQVLLWPFVDERMVLPLLPWLVLALVAGGHQAIKGRDRVQASLRSFLSALAPAVLGAWVLVLGISLAIEASRPGGVAGSGPAARGRVLAEVVQAIDRHVPPGAVVGAPEFWAILHLRTGRPVVPSTRFRPGMGLEAVGTPAEQHRQWAVGRVAALVDEGVLHRDALAALAEACGDEALQVVDQGAGFRLVLLTWDVSCRRRVIPGWEETAG